MNVTKTYFLIVCNHYCLLKMFFSWHLAWPVASAATFCVVKKSSRELGHNEYKHSHISNFIQYSDTDFSTLNTISVVAALLFLAEWDVDVKKLLFFPLEVWNAMNKTFLETQLQLKAVAEWITPFHIWNQMSFCSIALGWCLPSLILAAVVQCIQGWWHLSDNSDRLPNLVKIW